MKDVFIEVLLEVSTRELRTQQDPAEYVFGKLRDEAEKKCEEEKAQLRTDKRPEVHVKEAVHRLTAEDTTLIAARFPVVAPESLETQPI